MLDKINTLDAIEAHDMPMSAEVSAEVSAEAPSAMSTNLPAFGNKVNLRALLVGDRIDTPGLEGGEMLAATPYTYRAGENGVVTVFRYGVVVLMNMTGPEEKDALKKLRKHVAAPLKNREEEEASVEVSAEREDQIPPGGPVYVREITLERLLLVAYALADSVILAYDERAASGVFETIDPFARELAEKGRTPKGRRAMLKQIGSALLVRQRLSGRVAVGEDPDVLWDRPDFGRLYARLKDEYELKERAEELSRKLVVISETAQALTDLIDTERSLRLETMIVLLIVFEIGITFYQMYMGSGGH